MDTVPPFLVPADTVPPIFVPADAVPPFFFIRRYSERRYKERRYKERRLHSFPTGGLSVFEQCIEEFSNLVLVCINRHISGI